MAILGILIGPIYPTAISVASKTLPARLYAVSIGFIAAVNNWPDLNTTVFAGIFPSKINRYETKLIFFI